MIDPANTQPKTLCITNLSHFNPVVWLSLLLKDRTYVLGDGVHPVLVTSRL